ncbi:GMC family oxidoreductase [Paracraurococcus lichenis]|uniref:GMC family oxidoreductase N-terminal domain-containing protein n=1 Tax=Paracraurococcus lichenis TaxID=3064888 RepID=A0ABT9E7N4_9PROT|nr:GMC family oxidoreductase N-terminal domain-containing protein [Paracraurococcus sp. LOR1-02]MDO9712122.1 GMC family oxidoreductase N-terminal domain-containing protein [Paracraurococcus sp. LOR1-02]
MDYSHIIIGGGSAGSVLANRLSARSANRVLLLEAGQDTPPGQVPKEIEDTYPGTAYFDPRFHWTDLKVRTQVVSHNDPHAAPPPLRKYEQARVLGGGSSINGQMANRGAPTDFDEWEARGAAGWNWQSVLPYFKKVERDLDIADEWHGRDGPITVTRIPEARWPAHARATAEAFRQAGFKHLPDQNGRFEDGYFPVTVSIDGQKRVSAAVGYLNEQVRARGNLTISTRTQVTGLLFEGRRCVGVTALVEGQPREFRGREVILSAGAIHSPAILLRNGIGPVGHLREMGIELRSALPGVGQRLMDHPSISLSSFIRRPARLTDAHSRRHILLGLRYSSGIPEAPRGDMFVAVASKSAWHSVGQQIASLLAFVNKTYSESGQVRLASTRWQEEPVVEFNLLSDRRDLDRLMAGFRMLAAIQLSAPLAAVTTDPFPAAYSDKVRAIGVVNERNRWITRAIATLLDGPPALRSWLIEKYVVEGFTFRQVMQDEEALEAFIRKATIGVWHASCSCRMGREDDPMAVVDTEGRVRGIEGLRVVDASIFPVVPCANTNFPVLMTAEKIADAMLAEAAPVLAPGGSALA